MENRTKKIEQLLMWSKILDKHVSEFNLNMYNKQLNQIKFESNPKDYNQEEAEAMNIIQLIATITKVPKDYYKTRIRTRFFSDWRQAGMALVRCNTKLTLYEIGKLFGDRDHTTVLAAHKQVDELLYSDATFMLKFEQIKKTGMLKYINYKDFKKFKIKNNENIHR